MICLVSHNSIVISGGLISPYAVMAYRGHCITQNSFSLRYAHLALLIHIWHGWMVILPEENWKRLCAAPQYVLASVSGCFRAAEERLWGGRDWWTFVCSVFADDDPHLYLRWRLNNTNAATDTEVSIRSSASPQLRNSCGLPSLSRLGASKARWREKNTSCRTDRGCSDCQISVELSSAIHSTAYSSEIPTKAVCVLKTNTGSPKSASTASHLFVSSSSRFTGPRVAPVCLLSAQKTSNLLVQAQSSTPCEGYFKLLISETPTEGRWTLGPTSTVCIELRFER